MDESRSVPTLIPQPTRHESRPLNWHFLDEDSIKSKTVLIKKTLTYLLPTSKNDRKPTTDWSPLPPVNIKTSVEREEVAPRKKLVRMK